MATTIALVVLAIALFTLLFLLLVKAGLEVEYARSEKKVVEIKFPSSEQGRKIVLHSKNGTPFTASVVVPIQERFYAHCGYGKSDSEGKIVFAVTGDHARFLVPRGADTVIVFSRDQDQALTPTVTAHLPRWWQKLGIWA